MLLACLMVPALVSLAVCELDNEAQAEATNGTATNPPHAQPASQTRKPAAPPTATQTKPAASAASSSDALEQALRQKMNELNTKPSAAPTPPPAAPAAQSAPPPAPKPSVATPVAPAPSAAPAAATAAAATATAATAAAAGSGQDRTSSPPDAVLPAGASTSDMDKARAALHQKMSDLNAQDAAGAGASAVAATAVTAPPPDRVVVVTGDPSEITVTNPSRDATVNAAVQESLNANKANPKPNPPATVPANPSTQMTPINAPPLPISLSKEERLQALLRRYQQDQISPEQYHEQRAKILAEP
jgi:hypothetical protein